MTLAGKTVLITGATGFLGGALALRLARDGAQVRALSRSLEKGAFLRPSVELVQGDVTNPASLRYAMDGCSVVFHLAVSIGDWRQQRAVNVEGTRKVAQAVAAVRVERFVHVSSIAVYGYKVTGEITEATALTTTSHDPYSITKAEGEKALREVVAERDLPLTIIRPGMIYGARSLGWTEGLFKIARRNPTIFIGDGGGSAQPIHVDDVVDMMILLATHPRAVGEAFNCAPDPAPTWREWLGAYAQLAGHQKWFAIPPGLVRAAAALVALIAPSSSRLKDLPDFVQMLDNRGLTYKMTKARERLGWQPKVDLQTGVAGCAPWLRERGLLR